jgi:NAD(P)-dependent dehydrogenase (short-subunit alcohol dehydrogenase family)/6-phosphogluconolactonase/glucosamine-6-phosphate isomerase/deaminase
MAQDPEPTERRRVERLTLEVYADRRDMGVAAGRTAAAAIKTILARQARCRVVFAAAPSQNEFLAELSVAPGIDWARVTAFHMDEYVGLGPDAPQSFVRFLKEHILDTVKPGQVHFLNGLASDPQAECVRYAALLSEAPIDAVFAGIGENGHLAFNDPPDADFHDTETVKVIQLALRSRQQQVHDGCFERLESVPTRALTLTIPALMAARRIFCMVPGPTKAEAIRDTLSGAVRQECPATILRQHLAAVLYADADSASLVKWNELPFTRYDLADLEGQVAVVTGGGGILCSTISRGLAAQGVKVAVLDIRLDAAKVVADGIRAAGGDAIPVQVDVLNKASVEAARDQVLAAYGRLDILVNGAGGNKKQATADADLSFFDMPLDAIRWVYELNFLGTLIPCQVFGRVMAEQAYGCILNVSSMAAIRPLTRTIAYSAAKAAVSNLTQWLAVHMAQNYSPMIRVNALAPGFFRTEQNRFLLFDQATGELTSRGQKILDHTPMAKFGEPEDLVPVTLWLLSRGAGFVHGAIIPIDGGFSAFSGV